METISYKELMDDSPVGIAIHRMIRDHFDRGIDYEFLEVNRAFEEITGLMSEDILGRKMTEILPNFESGEFSWIAKYDQLFRKNEKVIFSQYSESLKRWYRVTAKALNEDQFVTYFLDITSEKDLIKDKDAILMTLNQIIFEIDESFVHRNVLVTDEQFLFMPKNEIIGRTLADVLAEPLQTQFTAVLENARDSGKKEILEYPAPFSNDDRHFRAEAKFHVFDTGNRWVIAIQDISERVRLEQNQRSAKKELRRQSKRLSYILDGTNAGTWEWNMITDEVTVNNRWSEMKGNPFGKSRKISIDDFYTLVHQDDREYLNRNLQHVMNGEQVIYTVEIRILHTSGYYIWIESRGKIMEWNEQGEAALMSGTHLDVSRRKHVEKERELEREQFRTTLLAIGDGVISTDHTGQITMMNRMAEEWTGWSYDEAFGKPVAELFILFDEATAERLPCPVNNAIRLQKKIEIEDHTILQRKNGERICISDSVAPIYTSAGTLSGTVIVFRNITEKRERARQIEYLSIHDQLTGLYNRYFYDQIMQELTDDHDEPFSIIVADVNGLKLANDGFGHRFGDQLLKKVADILKSHTRSSDILARIVGDEFIVLMRKTDHIGAGETMKRLNQAISEGEVENLELSVSFGFASRNTTDINPMDVFKRAEDSMYHRKIDESQKMRKKTIELILHKLNTTNGYARLHGKQVKDMSLRIGQALDISWNELYNLGLAAGMHDIGLISINPMLLDKSPDIMTEQERLSMQKHPEIGYQLLRTMTEFTDVAEIVLCHQEHPDGTGYPRGIRSGQIPMESKIIHAACYIDRALHNRCISVSELLHELDEKTSISMDSKVVDAIKEILC